MRDLMTKQRAAAVTIAGLLGAVLFAAPRPTAAQPAVTPPPAGESTVKSIDLPMISPNLPDAPGRNAVIGSCTICHTPAYVTLQPPFPRKTWEATVDKMRKVYGAPVPDAVVPEIVGYLMAVRGKADAPATQPAKTN
jgi:hypothetical protein